MSTQREPATHPQRYYALISSDKPTDINDRICTSIDQVNEKMKTLRKARFKSFVDLQMAIEYASSVLHSPVDNLAADLERCLHFEPSGREYNELKRNVERGEFDKFTVKINRNPRYMINSYDLPPIIQRGFRYNVAHLCCINARLDMLSWLLDSVESGVPLRRLYPSAREEVVALKVGCLVECYLNTPEKGNNETPLHLAAKFGNADVVAFLLSHPKTDKTRRNKQNLTAREIVCTRANPHQADRIRDLFEAEFYVAFVKDEMCSPRLLSPLRINAPNKLSPRVRIRGLAGPVGSETAKAVTKMWRDHVKTPPNNKSLDIDSIFQQTGRNITAKLNINWMEHWQFLNCFEDLRSPTGLRLTEDYFTRQFLTFLLPHFVASGEDDRDSLCSLDSFESCLSHLSSDCSPYSGYPQLFPWLGTALSRLRFCCCGPPVGGDPIVVSIPLSFTNVDNLTEVRLGFRSSECLLADSGLVGTLRELLVGWRGLIRGESCVYRCRESFSVVLDLRSVCEMVLWHERGEVRVRFPVCEDDHRLVLFVTGRGDLPSFIGGVEPSLEDFDAFSVLGHVSVDEDVYPLIGRWLSSMKSYDL